MRLPFLIITLALGIIYNVIAQQSYQEITLVNQEPFLLGKITENHLMSQNYASWYTPNYEKYETDNAQITLFRQNLSAFKILVFMGTWCGDSKRELPRFVKILKEANYPMENLKIVAVDKRKDNYKKSPQGEEWALHIRRVPTFIFYKNGREVNRIIESPISTLEGDIFKIVSGEAYIPNYATTLHFD
ncbi:Thioredoxin [Maribacter sedimenticola]|uniref:Thioredoxin n=1 Tax=Maribacter sedimenticola TaxID=228956 RepID=A0ABY1SM00_9FLAO|nr:thioredoxin family protein [Maribacter sedimenticola]SNR75710.1 Thioredoxin [Maribacter sedimenticola]